MMYANRAAVAIKVNGKVLREFKDTVYIPFSSEYSILIKNLNTRRAIFNIFIDGDNIVPNGLVLNAGQEIDLERAIRNNNLTEGNRFKFIERTGAIEEHRGIKLEDGLIRIEYQFEKEYPKPVYREPNYGLNPVPYWEHTPLRTWYSTSNSMGEVKGMSSAEVGAIRSSAATMSVDSMMVGSSVANASLQSFNAVPQNEAGITVPGSKSEQKFKTVSNFAVDPEKHSMIIKLLGETEDNKPVIAPVTVHTKVQCTTCNRKNKATAKFCSDCGTSLTIYA
jgi:hypothetical protein